MRLPTALLHWFRATIGLVVLLAGVPVVMPSGFSAAAQGGNSTVIVHKRECPTGYTGNNYYEDCHDNPHSGITITLGDREATTGDDGNVTFEGLAAGTYAVSENIPGEFVESNVYCSFTEDGQPTGPASFQETQGGIELDVPADSEISCDWYNTPFNLRGTPTDGDGDGDGTPGASVRIHKASCPAGVEPADLYEECHDNPLSGVTFTFAGSLTATTGPDGDALFYQLRPGNYAIREGIPGSFQEFRVFCSLGSPDQPVDFTYLTDGIRVQVPADTEVICDWYDIRESADVPDGDPNEGIVTVHKLRCPAGYEGSSFYEDCHENRFEGVELTALGSEGYLREATTDAEGTVIFDDITVGGGVNISETVLEDIADLRIYCSNEEGNRAPFDRQETAAGPGIVVNVSPGDRILCDWYNIPAVQQGAGASVLIHKRLCPTGFQGTDFYGTCHDNPQEGVTFTLDNLRTTTGQDGNALFYQLQGGTYTVTEETLPGDFVSSRVFCSFGPGGGDELFTDVRTGIELDVPANTRVICDWYNVPDETRGADGQQQFNLPIIALTCESDPGAVTPNRLDTAGLPEGCSYAEGVGFDVVAEDGSVIGECTTDSDGRCSVATSVGTTVAVREEPETVREGYAPQDNPHEVTAAPGAGVGVIFVNLPENGG
jgi:uncharacterized protein (DUF2141 family)